MEIHTYDMRIKKFRYFVGDFETTVYAGQEFTEVWASACVELFSEDVKIFHSIDDTFEYYKSLNENIIVYYHNLKFDGNFWLSYLFEKGFKQAAYDYTDYKEEKPNFKVKWVKDKFMDNNTFKYSISNKGMWYNIIIKVKNHFIEIRDSLKLLPFSVEEIGETFGTKHKKSEIEYTGFRYAGCNITEEEKEYIANDVLVVKEALEIMFNENHKALTIGSCCLKEFKELFKRSEFTLNPNMSYENYFPDLTEYLIDKEKYGSENADAYIRKSYKGGWCYVKESIQGKIQHNGSTFDVNSLYPSVMHSESGSFYPVGNPLFWKGNYIPEEALRNDRYYFVRIKTRFYLKEDYLPFIQIKGTFLYRGTECLKSSDIYDYKTKRYYTHSRDIDGNVYDTRVELTLTKTDFELICEHYNLVDFEILDGCWFYAEKGLFDEYINKYRKIKLESKGAKRTLAKLFLNNLYGKMASSDDSSFKYAIWHGDMFNFVDIKEHNKQVEYIPIGSAITSYARNFTIRAAQKNYKYFCYADTDSIHCCCPPDKVKGIKVHDKDFCCWKNESIWDMAIFTRQKTYIEHVTVSDGEKVEKPFYDIKCAGMPKKSKELFELSLNGNAEYNEEWTEEEKEFLFDENNKVIHRDVSDFKIGLLVPDKLVPKRIKGGVILVNTTYQLR